MIRHRMVMFLGILGAGLSADSGAAQQNHVPAYADKSGGLTFLPICSRSWVHCPTTPAKCRWT